MERSITIRSIRIKRPISTGAGCHAGHVSGFVLTHFGLFLSEGADLRTSMRTREREKMRFAQEIDVSVSKEWCPGTSAKTKAHFSPMGMYCWACNSLCAGLRQQRGEGWGGQYIRGGISLAARAHAPTKQPCSRASQPTRTKPPCNTT